jgi:hypothetical protein
MGQGRSRRTASLIRPVQSSEKPKQDRRLSISTIVILVLAAIAGAAYYYGTPPVPPSAPVSTDCPTALTQIVIPYGVGVNSSIKYEPPTLTLIVGLNNTAVWNDQDTTTAHVVIAVKWPNGALPWQINPMIGGSSYCVILTAPGTYVYEMYLPYIVEGTIVVKTGS